MNLIDKIDAFLMQKEDKPREHHYPSDAYQCLRKLYYKWTGEPVSNPMTPGQVWKMELGNATHDKLIQLAKNSGIQINEETTEQLPTPK